MNRPLNLHAGCVLVDEAGLLIRGPAGAGKSSLGRDLVLAALAGGRFARLVADDRVLVSRHGDRLLARPHPALAGMQEWRGGGLIDAAHEPAARLALVVDLGETPARLPDEAALFTTVLDIALPRLAARDPAEALRLLVARFSLLARR